MNDFDRRMDDFNYRLKLIEKSSNEHNNNEINPFNDDLRFWFLINFIYVCLMHVVFLDFCFSIFFVLCLTFFFASPVQYWIFVYWAFNICGKKNQMIPVFLLSLFALSYTRCCYACAQFTHFTVFRVSSFLSHFFFY